MLRNARGQFLPGQVMGDDLKAAISRGQIARHQRACEQQTEEPELKRCTQCRAWKRRKDDFTQRRRLLASGEVKLYPAGECKDCAATRAEGHREKLRREGRLSAKQREWNKSRDPISRRHYQREYGRIQRALQGAKSRGPWKRYRFEIENERDIMLPRGPFRDWLSGIGMTPKELMTATGIDEGVFRRDDSMRVISLRVVDQIFTRLGMPDQIAVLWPYDVHDERRKATPET